jgi:hypothetical protein
MRRKIFVFYATNPSDEVGMPSRDGALRWGGGSCVNDKAGNAGRYQASVVDDTKLVVKPRWSAVNWFTTSPFSMATT